MHQKIHFTSEPKQHSIAELRIKGQKQVWLWTKGSTNLSVTWKLSSMATDAMITPYSLASWDSLPEVRLAPALRIRFLASNSKLQSSLVIADVQNLHEASVKARYLFYSGSIV